MQVLGKEPNFTNFAMNKSHIEQQLPAFCDTLDYIFFRNGQHGSLKPVSVDNLKHRDDYMGSGIRSFPTVDEPSDHVKIAAEFTLSSK